MSNEFLTKDSCQFFDLFGSRCVVYSKAAAFMCLVLPRLVRVLFSSNEQRFIFGLGLRMFAWLFIKIDWSEQIIKGNRNLDIKWGFGCVKRVLMMMTFRLSCGWYRYSIAHCKRYSLSIGIENKAIYCRLSVECHVTWIPRCLHCYNANYLLIWS